MEQRIVSYANSMSRRVCAFGSYHCLCRSLWAHSFSAQLIHTKLPYACTGIESPDQPTHSHSQTWAFVARLQNQWLLWNSDEQRQLILPFDFHENKLYNIDPLKPHFYIVKLGFTGVCIIFLISAQKHRLWYSLEPPRRGGSNEYPQYMFWAKIWKISELFIWKFSVFGGEIFYIFEKACFRNET